MARWGVDFSANVDLESMKNALHHVLFLNGAQEQGDPRDDQLSEYKATLLIIMILITLFSDGAKHGNKRCNFFVHIGGPDDHVRGFLGALVDPPASRWSEAVSA